MLTARFRATAAQQSGALIGVTGNAPGHRKFPVIAWGLGDDRVTDSCASGSRLMIVRHLGTAWRRCTASEWCSSKRLGEALSEELFGVRRSLSTAGAVADVPAGGARSHLPLVTQAQGRTRFPLLKPSQLCTHPPICAVALQELAGCRTSCRLIRSSQSCVSALL